MSRKDLVSGAFWVLISLVVLQQSLGLGIGTFFNPGAGAFPFFCGSFMLLLAGGIAIRAIDRGKNGRSSLAIEWPVFARLGTIIGALLAYILVFPRLGFFFTTFCLLSFLFRNPRNRSWWPPFLAAALTIGASYFLFHSVLKIEFPRGPWIFR